MDFITITTMIAGVSIIIYGICVILNAPQISASEDTRFSRFLDDLSVVSMIVFWISIVLVICGIIFMLVTTEPKIDETNKVRQVEVLKELPKVDVPKEFADITTDIIEAPIYYKDETNDSEFQMYTVKEVPSQIKKQVSKADKRYTKKKALKYYYFKKLERYIVFIYEKDDIKIIEATGSSYKPYVFKLIQDTVKAKS